MDFGTVPVLPVSRPAAVPCRCTASDVLRWAGLPALASAATDGVAFAMRRVPAGQSLVAEGQPFDRLHLVGSGSFKCVQTDLDGYEQVLAFAIHGDLIGLDALGHDRHRSGSVALEDAAVVTLPIVEWLALVRRLPALETLLHRAIGAEVARRGEHQQLMAAPGADVRVARFLLQFARRQASLGHSARRLRIVTTRRDIASYLGVAHETVSRALASLAAQRLIAVSNRDIELLDLDALNALQRATRGRPVRERRDDAVPAPHGAAGSAAAAVASALH